MIRRPFSYSLGFLTLCVLGGFTLLCLLGCWQLHRAQQKAHMLAQFAEAKKRAPLKAEDLPPGDYQAYRFYPVTVSGIFINDQIILLDNKINQGKVGYHVVVPLKLNNGNLILINRGWIPMGHSRQDIPEISPINGQVTIEGYLDFAYRNLLISTALETTTIQWPLRMQQLEYPLLERLLGRKIYPMLVNLNSDSPYAFAVSRGDPKVPIPPERHYGYAFQWFSLAAVLMVIYGLLLRKYQAKK